MNVDIPGVTFPAWRGRDFIPLIELLLVVGPFALDYRWSLTGAEFAPGWRGSEALDRLSASGRDIPTLRLVELVSDGIQLVDGTVVGRDQATQEPSLVITSVRGDNWDVRAREEAVLSYVRERFGDVRDLPD
jgi:hypothetical protein